MPSYDSLSTHAFHIIARCCGAAGRAQVAQAQAEARQAAHDAETRRAVEAALLAEWPKLARVRERAQRGDYADDSDVLLTIQERDRLRFTAWLVAHGRMGS